MVLVLGTVKVFWVGAGDEGIATNPARGLPALIGIPFHLPASQLGTTPIGENPVVSASTPHEGNTDLTTEGRIP